ncbi:hypothetical protein [Acidovorax sp. Leaf160]|uniref:hypothetical protein n=1 Tax=Acidovorax sp. Leaf160 TaxID=1736280 RepID=UPI0012E3B2ED|nr:hypothetical protein [Acidovorax sp. Leaf160]
MRIETIQINRAMSGDFKPTIRLKINSPPGLDAQNTGTKVTISKDAYQAADLDSSQSVNTNRPLAGVSLKDLLARYDFKNVTPEDFAELAAELLARKQISGEVAGNFMGTHIDLVKAVPRDKPINMIAHMELMAETAKTPSPVSLKSRDEELTALKNMVSVASGLRDSVK